MSLFMKRGAHVYSIIRLILIIIITFTLSTGITFPVVSLKVNENQQIRKIRTLMKLIFVISMMIICYL